MAVQRQRLIQDGGIGGEATLPVGMAEDDERMRTGRAVVGG
jgi:hypothetical protein